MPWIEKAERLEAQNAQLIAALELVDEALSDGFLPDVQVTTSTIVPDETTTTLAAIVRAALSAAKGDRG
jgi:hypothetical protein